MADQYRGSGLLPSVTAKPGPLMSDQQVRQADNAARASELGSRAMESSAELDRQAAMASVQARVDAARKADAARRGDPTYGAQEMQDDGTADFATAFRETGRPGTAVTSRRPFYRETKQYNDTMRGTATQPGLVDEVIPLAGQVQQAELEQQAIAASSMEEMADRQLQAMTQLRANQQASADRGAAQLDRQRRMNDLALKAADDLAASADVDPGKGWADAPLWSKFFAVIGAGLMGWAGHADPLSHIRAVTDQSIRAQEAALAKKQLRVGNLTNQAALEESLYEKIQAESASKLEGDLVYTKAILMHAQQQAMARLQRAGVQVLNSQQQQFMNGLQQEVAGIDLQLNKQAAANTPTVTTMRPAYNSDQRGLLRELGKQGLKDASAGRAAVVDTAQKREASAAKLAEDQAAGGPGSIEERKFRFQQRTELNKGEKAATRQAAIAAIQGYQGTYGDDIPGRTETTIPIINEGLRNEFSQAGRKEQLQRNLIGKWAATVLTGANVSPTQEAFLTDLVEGKELSGDQIRSGMSDLLSALESEQATAERALEPEAAAEYRGVSTDQLPDFAPKTGGRQRSGGSAQDEAAALGGKLR